MEIRNCPHASEQFTLSLSLTRVHSRPGDVGDLEGGVMRGGLGHGPGGGGGGGGGGRAIHFGGGQVELLEPE